MTDEQLLQSIKRYQGDIYTLSDLTGIDLKVIKAQIRNNPILQHEQNMQIAQGRRNINEQMRRLDRRWRKQQK